MPRATRAAMRAQELVEEAIDAAAIALPPTPTRERVPLGEISENRITILPISVEMPSGDDSGVPMEKSKKSKGGKKGKKGKKVEQESNETNVLEDDCQSSQSEAVDEACVKLVQEKDDDIQAIVLPDRISSPASNAATEVSSIILNHKLSVERNSDTKAKTEQADILSETKPSSEVGTEPIISSTGTQILDEELPTVTAGTINPHNRMSRIEDSVEALDKLEDELDKLDQAIPSATNGVGPMASGKNDGQNTSQKTSKGRSAVKAKAAKAAKPTHEPVKNKTPVKRAEPVRKSKSTVTPSSNLGARPYLGSGRTQSAKKETAKAVAKAPELIAQKAPAKRISSIHNAPFQTTKSTKAPTVSTFALPGEAVARKLKEQREERLRRQQASELSKEPFKARSVRTGQGPVVKMTAATKARLSLAHKDSDFANSPKIGGNTSKQLSPSQKTKPLLPAMKRENPVANKRMSSTLANTSVKRAPSLAANATMRRISTLANMSKSVNGVKPSERPGFGKPRSTMAEQDLERRTREDAAKKARAEASERGRQASREWAERQKAKKAAAMRTVAEGKTITA